MMKTLLVPLTGDPGDNAALETAYLLARPFNAHITGLNVTPGWGELAGQVALSDVQSAAVSAELLAGLQQQVKAMAWRAHRHFAEACRRWQIPVVMAPQDSHAVSAEMRDATGDFISETAAEARFHDLLVVGRTAEAHGFGALIVGAGRPVVIAPSHAPENLAPTIAIAWKETAEAARALTAAMPLLCKADKVLVLAADEGRGHAETANSADRIATHLRWHGVAVEVHCIPPREPTVAGAIALTAVQQKADLLVMGGYGHSRLRELVLGGMTRDVLSDCALPVFLFH